MTDALPDWDNDPLERWQPSASERARSIELLLLRADDDPRFATAFNAFCSDVLSERSLPQVLLAVIDHATTALTATQGKSLTVNRLAGDLHHACKDALEEMR